MKIKADKSLDELLQEYLSKGKEIAEYVKNKGAKRFSTKKFVADLGEYYFYENCKDIFETLDQNKKATADYDFSGSLKQGKILNTDVRIEVKTRHAQDGNPYLLGVKPKKFDILAFIFLDENLSCRYIGIVNKKEIKNKITGKNKDIIVYDKNIQTLWETGAFKKIPKKNKAII
jgi:hypothetical protein